MIIEWTMVILYFWNSRTHTIVIPGFNNLDLCNKAIEQLSSNNTFNRAAIGSACLPTKEKK